MMLISIKILLLLFAINFAPAFLSFLMEDKWSAPVDFNAKMWDGRPLFGSHKTIRGICAAILAGTLIGILLNFLWWEGFCAGLLSMAGDLLSSFIKRRAGLAEGADAPGLDQILEASIPFVFLSSRFSINGFAIICIISVFFISAYCSSLLFKSVLLKKPHKNYPRKMTPKLRMRELKSCQITSYPLQKLLNFEDAVYYHFFMKTVFKTLGVYRKGVYNALQIKLQNRIIFLPNLPTAFENYTILYISDLHLDGLKGITRRLKKILKPLPVVDLCILGGDYRVKMYGTFKNMLLKMEKLMKNIKTRDGIYAVLGNHDCIEMIQPMEDMGITFLVNDSIPLERHGSYIWLVGVDDPHYYKCHDLKQAFSEVPTGACSILASHSPAIYKEAEEYGTDLCLCGHTHAGQIQIPSFGPVFTHTRAPRKFCHGHWKFKNMTGYTSSGAGVSGVPVRFYTHGEVAHITLKKG